MVPASICDVDGVHEALLEGGPLEGDDDDDQDRIDSLCAPVNPR